MVLAASFAYASNCPTGNSCNTNVDCGNPANTQYICLTPSQAGVHSCVCGVSGCEEANTQDANECGTGSFCNTVKTKVCTRTGSCGSYNPTDPNNYGCFYTCPTTCTGATCVETGDSAECTTPTASSIPDEDSATPIPDDTPTPSDDATAGGFEAPTTAPSYDYSGFAIIDRANYSTALSLLLLAALTIAGYAVTKGEKA